MDYWEEHAEIALHEAGLPRATREQLHVMAGVLESAHDFYGQAHGHDVASVNLHAARERETERKVREAEAEGEREKEAVQAKLNRSLEKVRDLEWTIYDLRRENERLRR